jgi:enoyl-CoA hydratase/carnithine racemase
MAQKQSSAAAYQAGKPSSSPRDSEKAAVGSGEAPVRRTKFAGVLRLTLANPPANALSEAVIDSLQAAVDDAAADAAVRVVLIDAEGKLFSGGHDLKEMTAQRDAPDGGKSYFEEIFARCSRMMQSLVALEKPVIAVVGGIATAAGCQLVASSDIVIASERARFGVNGIDVGLFCSTPMVALSRNVGSKAALDMLMTGQLIDANRALAAGLVSRVVPHENLAAETDKVVQRLLDRPARVLALGKHAFYMQLGMPLAEAYRFTSATIAGNMLMDEAEEGISAFIEKRRANWR